jgi:formylglycine-generating enzyme
LRYFSKAAVKQFGIKWILVKGMNAPFYISSTPVTFAMFDKYCNATGKKKPWDEGWGRATRPVINVSWHDAQDYCKWASQKSGKTIRVPTDDEWAFAASGGAKSRGYEFSGSNTLDDVGWYNRNSGDKTHGVAQGKPNELGIYDMSGNVWEWCEDKYDAEHEWRVLRGGSFYDNAVNCRIAGRYTGDYPDIRRGGYGFRCVCLCD